MTSAALPQTAADKALAERDRLAQRYRRLKKAEHDRLFAIPVHGELLRKFSATLGHFDIDDADRMIEYVRQRNRAWLREAPDEIRIAALELIGNRIVRIRQQAGFVPFDDPLPEEEPDVFQLCKRELEL